MSKEAYYFSHDSNARNDTKILAMRSVYGIEGYGAYWVIVEMLREQENYKLKKGKYMFNAIAMQMQSNAYAKENAKDFVDDCINEFELLEEDETHIWSNSLLKRMEIKDTVSEKRREAANKRWGKSSSTNVPQVSISKPDANALQVQSKSNAMKGKESKRKEIKESKLKQSHHLELEQKKEPQPDDVVEGSAIKFYQENGFGPISPFVGNKVFAWIDDLNEPLVIHAMEKSIAAGVIKWSYVETILKDWYNKNIKSVAEVTAIDTQRKMQQKPFKGGLVVNKEKLPEWFEKHKETRGNKDAVIDQDEVDGDFIEQKRLLLKKLGVKE